jgi:hypothetical protein
MNAPKPVIVLIEVPGDRGVSRKVRPDYRRHKAQRPERWPPKQSIPTWDKDELRRRVEFMREGHRRQAEALSAAGLALRVALWAA